MALDGAKAKKKYTIATTNTSAVKITAFVSVWMGSAGSGERAVIAGIPLNIYCVEPKGDTQPKIRYDTKNDYTKVFFFYLCVRVLCVWVPTLLCPALRDAAVLSVRKLHAILVGCIIDETRVPLLAGPYFPNR